MSHLNITVVYLFLVIYIYLNIVKKYIIVCAQKHWCGFILSVHEKIFYDDVILCRLFSPLSNQLLL